MEQVEHQQLRNHNSESSCVVRGRRNMKYIKPLAATFDFWDHCYFYRRDERAMALLLTLLGSSTEPKINMKVGHHLYR